MLSAFLESHAHVEEQEVRMGVELLRFIRDWCKPPPCAERATGRSWQLIVNTGIVSHTDTELRSNGAEVNGERLSAVALYYNSRQKGYA